MPTVVPEAAPNWLVTIAQLSLEDPASRMRVLRTLESLGAAVMREGAYLLPDTADNRHALDALAERLQRAQHAHARRRVLDRQLGDGHQPALRTLWSGVGHAA